MTCIYGCKTDGTPCPRPHTCHTLGPKLADWYWSICPKNMPKKPAKLHAMH